MSTQITPNDEVGGDETTAEDVSSVTPEDVPEADDAQDVADDATDDAPVDDAGSDSDGS